MSDRDLRALERDPSTPREVLRQARIRAGLDPRGEHPRPSERTEEEATRIRQQRIGRVFEYLWNDGSPRVEGFDMGPTVDDDEEHAFGNWNHTYRVWENGAWRDTTADERARDLAVRAMRVLERLGVECDWSDRYLCCGCGKFFLTEPDSFSWAGPDGWIGDGDYCCSDCVDDDPEAYWESVASDVYHGPILQRNLAQPDWADDFDDEPTWLPLVEIDGASSYHDELRSIATALQSDGIDTIHDDRHLLWVRADHVPDAEEDPQARADWERTIRAAVPCHVYLASVTLGAYLFEDTSVARG